MSAATAFYGASAFIGWPYIQGDCYEQLTTFEPSKATVKITLDITPKNLEAILSSPKRIPATSECEENIDCGYEGRYCDDKKECQTQMVPNGQCWSDHDCDEGSACYKADESSDDSSDGSERFICQELKGDCNTRAQCQIGEDCVKGSCTPADSTSMVAFPVTLYDVKCLGTIDFSCSVTFSVPNKVEGPKRNEQDKENGLDYEYLLQEVNARFSPANVDLANVNLTEFSGEKSDLYGVQISLDDVEIQNPLPPQTTTTTDEPTTTDQPTTSANPDGSGDEGSGETAWL